METLDTFQNLISALYSRCAENAPNYGVTLETFQNALTRAVCKYLYAGDTQPTRNEIEEFLNALNHQDLFLALACAAGNERAWWEFDQNYRSYLERAARHLASSEINASDVIDTVYVDLYGTRIVDGVRISKFATYTGRGNLRGWLRTVIWHSLVDLHRAGHDEVSLDEMTEKVGEGETQSNFLTPAKSGEREMIDELMRERYRKATVAAMENAFAALDNHEKLLLLYYHVENLRLREIARIVEVPSSPLRGWFSRRAAERETGGSGKVHESTVMRWLDKTYTKILRSFRNHLRSAGGLNDGEIELCLEFAAEDLAHGDFAKHLTVSSI
jgi:RNA polymerase sigma-70 factor